MWQDLLLKHMRGWVMTACTQKHEFLCLKRVLPFLPGCRSVVPLVVIFRTAELKRPAGVKTSKLEPAVVVWKRTAMCVQLYQFPVSTLYKYDVG